MYNMYSMTFSNAARNSIFTNLQLLFLEFSLMKLAISNILVVYYVETMIFLGKLSYPCVTKCCKMESSWEMYFYVTRIIDIAMTLARDQVIWMTIKSWPNYISSETNLLESTSLMMKRHFYVNLQVNIPIQRN